MANAMLPPLVCMAGKPAALSPYGARRRRSGRAAFDFFLFFTPKERIYIQKYMFVYGLS